MTLSRRTTLHWAAPIFGLLWLALPAVDFAASDPSALQIALVGIVLPAFAALFLGTAMEPRAPLAPIAGMLAIAVALTLLTQDGFGLLFIYAPAAAGVRLRERENVLAVLAITALAAATLALAGPDGEVFWGITSAVFATGGLWLLIGGLLRANSALRDARAELAEVAVGEERLRLARDLHDLLGHDLSLIARSKRSWRASCCPSVWTRRPPRWSRSNP